MKICLIGGSGLVGGCFIQLLERSNEDFELINLGRTQPQSAFKKFEFLKVQLSELNSLNEIKADHFVCTLGTTIKTAGSQVAFAKVDYQAVLDFAKIAERSRAKSLHIVSALGADANSSIFYNQIKGKMQSSVSALSISSIYFYQPSLLLGDRKEFRLGEKIAIKLAPVFSLLMQGPLKSFAPIRAKQVAASILNHYKTPSPGIHVISNLEMLGEKT